MKKNHVLAFLLLCAVSVNAQPYSYPATHKTDVTDNYFGTVIPDPYRWLEDDRSAETGAWVEAQNKCTNDYLSRIPFREHLRERLRQLWNFPKSATPFKAGNNYFVYRNNGLQNQFVLDIIRKPGAEPQPFIDPNTLSADGTVNIPSLAASHDGKYLAYALSKAGSDWEEIRVRDTRTGKDYGDRVEWIKFSGIAWKGDGFYYSRYDAPDSANLLKGKNEYHKVYYHHIGDKQEKDALIYVDKEHPLRNFSAGVTDDERFLIISGSEGTSGNNLMVKDLQIPNSEFKVVVSEFGSDFDVIDNDGTRLLIKTNKDAPRYRLMMADASDPSKPWQVVIPEQTNVLQEVTMGNNMIIAKYMEDAKSVLKVYSTDGKFQYDIPLDKIGNVEQLSASKKDPALYYSLITFTAPATIYKFDMTTRKQEIYFRPKMDFDPDQYETKEIFYSGRDGVKIPMFITCKKGLRLDGTNPTLIYGYGGFNIARTPEFKIERLLFLENGGVFAAPCLRGGGEYGEQWHEAGTKLNKQNVFDDCIAAAEYLIREGYTSTSKLAIQGRSNGGLLAGACMTERPDLFRVALPMVGVLDMLRYHKFTIGWAWKGDYGSSEDELNFRNLLKYSPLHNITEGVEYPATLVVTGDHDDRVVPAHSFKFIATLQEKYKGKNPVMIRVDMNTGHASTTPLGSSKPVAKQIEEMTDIFSFLFYNLGMTVR